MGHSQYYETQLKVWDLWLPSVLWGWPLLVPQPLSLKGLLLPSACWPIPLRCHSLHLVTSTWFLCCKALTGKGDLNCHGRAGVRADPHRGLPGPMAADRAKLTTYGFPWLLQSTPSGSRCTTEHFSTLHFVRMTAALHTCRMSLQ